MKKSLLAIFKIRPWDMTIVRKPFSTPGDSSVPVQSALSQNQPERQTTIEDLDTERFEIRTSI